jgi:hypothetical protein
MILDDDFWAMPSETHCDQLTRLRTALSLLRSYHGKAAIALDYLRNLDAHLAPAGLLRIWVLAISEELDHALAFGSNLRSEYIALDRSIRDLMNHLCRMDDKCVRTLGREDTEKCLAAFLRLDGALLSPISILDYLLSEEEPRQPRDMTAMPPIQLGRWAEPKRTRARR